MKYAKLNIDKTFKEEIGTDGPIEWDSNNFCSAEALVKDGKADQFLVSTLLETPKPEYDSRTQCVLRDGAEFVDNQWQYKWRIYDLTEEQIAVNQAETLAQTQASYTTALEAMYDTTAQSRKYDNRLTCALRAGYAGPFQAEGTAFAVWMDTCNAYAYQVMTEVLLATRPLPTVQELISELPELVWPA